MAFTIVEPPIAAAAQALRTLAAAADEVPISEEVSQNCLAAIQALQQAPAENRWDKGLLLGLRLSDQRLINHTIEACRQRLELTPDFLSRDRFIQTMLDECLLNLPKGRRRIEAQGGASRRADRLNNGVIREQAAAGLLNLVLAWIEAHPLELEHQRSRFLSGCRRIRILDGTGEFAEAVIHWQKRLAEQADRSDNRTVRILCLKRKQDAYQTSGSSESALFAHLEQDRLLSATDISAEVFRLYRVLLHQTSRERAPRAVLSALNNLISWMEQVSVHNPADRLQLIQESLRASAGAPWETLSPIPLRHLQAGAELLPGPEHPEDLLRMIRERFGAEAAEACLLAGLRLLQTMPLARFRADELNRMLLGAERLSRSQAVWNQFFKVIGAMMSGLADFTAADESDSPRLKKRRQAMKALLQTDQQARDILYQIATDAEFIVSHDPELSRGVRQAAWRTLLELSPWNRKTLLQEGLTRHGRDFALSTLEISGRLNFREVWDFIEADRKTLLASYGKPTVDEWIKALADCFAQTSVRSVMRDAAGAPGLIMQAAISEQIQCDGMTLGIRPDTRQYAAERFMLAGFGAELRRERLKQNLIRTRQDLSDSNQAILGLETTISELNQQLAGIQTQRIRCSMHIRALIQQREIQAAKAWLETVGRSVKIEEIRRRLEAETIAAHRQTGKLTELQEHIQTHLHECQNLNDITQILWLERDRHDQERTRLRRAADKAESESRRLYSALQALTAKVEADRDAYPATPSFLAGYEKARDQITHMERSHLRHEREKARLESRLRDLQTTIAGCNQGIGAANAAMSEVSAYMQSSAERLQQLDMDLKGLKETHNAEAFQLTHLQQRIAELISEIERIEVAGEIETQAASAGFAQSTSQIEAAQVEMENIRNQLQSIATRLDSANALLDYQLTRSQELAAFIDQGRGEYDAASRQAETESQAADSAGLSRHIRREQEITEQQEFIVEFAYSLNRALRRKPLQKTAA